MPKAETFQYGPILICNHAIGEREPRIFVEYGPYFHHEYGSVVSAEEFVAALWSLPSDTPTVRSLSTVRDCCSFRPWTSIIERAIWWQPGETVVLQIGENKFTADTFHRLVRWLASVPFLDPSHEPHVELDAETRVRFEQLCQRLRLPSP